VALGTPTSLALQAVSAQAGAVASPTLSAGAAIGDLILVPILLGNGSATATVSDTKSNTYTVLTSALNSATNPFVTYWAYSVLTTALTTSDTVTVTQSTSVSVAFQVIQVTGAPTAAASIIKTHVENSTVSGISGGVMNGATTASMAVGQLALNLFGIAGLAGTSQTSGNGWTNLGLQIVAKGFYTEYKAIASAATQQATTTLSPAPSGVNYSGGTIEVNAGVAPAITSANSSSGTQSSAYTFTVTATGTQTPALSKTGTLPAGVTFTDNGNGTATIAGTPSNNGSFPITITAHGFGTDATQVHTITIASAFTPLAQEELQHALNRVAGTSNMDSAGAANVWASSTGLDLLGALNKKNNTTGLGLQAVLNALAGTSNLDVNGAARQLH
jgi:hypothetical protein